MLNTQTVTVGRTGKYTVRPFAERIQWMHDYLVRMHIQKEIHCGCDGILTMSCPACDEAMECTCELHPDREATACLRCRTSAEVWASVRGEEALPY